MAETKRLAPVPAGGEAASVRAAALNGRRDDTPSGVGRPHGGPSSPLPLQRASGAQHGRGLHRLGEELALIMRRLRAEDRDGVLYDIARIVAWPPETIQALGADRFGRPPVRELP